MCCVCVCDVFVVGVFVLGVFVLGVFVLGVGIVVVLKVCFCWCFFVVFVVCDGGILFSYNHYFSSYSGSSLDV